MSSTAKELPVKSDEASNKSPSLAEPRHLFENLRRQVKKHRELRRKRSRTRHLVDGMRGRPAELHPQEAPGQP